MDCAEFSAALTSADAAAGAAPELAAHAAGCSHCAQSLIALAASLSIVDSGIAPALRGGAMAETAAGEPHEGPELWHAVEAAVARERGARAWLRSLPTQWRIVLALAAAALLVVGLALLAPRVDLGIYPAWRLVLGTLLYAAALTALVRRALQPMHQLPTRGDWLCIVLGLGLPLLLALQPAAVLARPVAIAGQGRDCLVLSVALGLSFVAALRALGREARPDVRTRWVLLSAASLAANAALLFHCPIARPLHGLIVHGGMVPLALGLLLFAWAALQRRLRPGAL